MKKAGFYVIVFLLTVCMLFSVVSCGKKEESKAEYAVTLSATELTLDRYQTGELTASVTENGEPKDVSVTWASDNTGVVTVSNGVLTPVGEGTASVTASYEGASAACAVTVSDTGMRPVLELSESSLELVIGGDSITVDAQVVYLRETMTDAEITFTIQDPAIAEVDANGKVTAKSYGETTLTVAASWRNVESEFLTETIPVYVREDIMFELSAPVTTIYTYGGTVDEQEFSNTVTMSCKATSSGQEIAAEDISWKSSNTEIATIDADGVVTAKAEGEVQITANYTSAKQEYVSDPFTITVLFPVVDKTQEVSVDVDSSLSSASLNASDIFGKDTSIEKVTDSADETIDLYENGSFVMDRLTVGERVMTVRNPDYGYKIKVVVATKILRTEEDLKNMQTLGGVQEVKQTVNGTEITFYPYSGYFILGNDIRATVSVDEAHTYGAKANGHNGYRSCNVDNMGFTGTFDGRGHTISGFMLKNGGLFGDLSNGAVIKNVGFSDIKLNGSQGAVVAHSIRKAKLINVFVEVNNEKTADGYGSSSIARYADGVTLTNVVVVASIRTNYGQPANLIGLVLSDVNYSNLYVFHKDGMNDVLVNDNLRNLDIESVPLSKAGEVTFEGFDDVFATEGGIPVMKTMPVASVSELEVYSGSTTDLTQYLLTNYYTIDDSTLPEGVTIEDGSLKVAGTVSTSAFTFKVISSLNSSVYKEITVDVTAMPSEPAVISDHFEVDLSEKGALLLTLPEMHGYETGNSVMVGDQDLSEKASLSDGKISIPYDALVAGKYQVVVTTTTKLITYTDVEVITKIIRTEEDLKNMQTLGGVHEDKRTVGGTEITFYPYSGYFVLGNNIRATVSVDAEHAYGAKTCAHDGYRSANVDGMGFTGVFDGRGYTISGFTLKEGGIFGDVSTGAVIKNVAFTNIQLDGSKASGVAHAIRKAELNNIFLEVSNEKTNAGWGNSGLARYVDGITLKNVVAVSALNSKYGQPALLAGGYLSDITYENLHVFYKDGMVSKLTYGTDAKNMTDFKTVALSAAGDVEFGAFSDFFTTEGGMPVMKTVPVAASEVTMTADSTYNVANCVQTGYYTVDASSLPTGVTYADGVFTLTAEATGEFTFTVTSTLNSSLSQTVSVTIE